MGRGVAQNVGSLVNIPNWSDSYYSPGKYQVTSDNYTGGTLTFQFWDEGPYHYLEQTATVNIIRVPDNLAILGPDVVCSSANYSVTPAVEGGYSWSSSNTSILTINSSTGVASKVGTGFVQITATSNWCGFSKTRTVYCGNPSPINNMIVRMGPSEYQLCLNTEMGIAVGNSNHTSQGITQYNWSMGGWYSYFTSFDTFGGLNSTSIAQFNLTSSAPSSETLYVAAQNACGTSSLYSKTFYSITCGGFRMAYPNPVSEELILQYENSGEPLPDQIELVSEKSQKAERIINSAKISSDLEKEKVVRIPIKGIAPGNYFLKISNSKGKSSSERILVE